ncbi:tetratricopeptide repeat protein [Cellvibrio sp. NN19]|uniref:tetratricopeptide repeat protein n=1 Tax=Cellvibrio chitinivorans TaxID=3102792 RepID=UPI002B407D13|nr:tetratricopeptide repeat protein [Cellvibrio sp. NN19]
MGKKQRRGEKHQPQNTAPATVKDATTQDQSARKKIWPVIAGAIALVAIGASAWYFSAKPAATAPSPVAAISSSSTVSSAPTAAAYTSNYSSTNLPPKTDYVGQQQCAACHPKQVEDWKKSHHAQAMALANDQTVLGDFNQASFSYEQVKSRFFMRDGKYFVNTDGPDGRLQDFEVHYTFGVYPLQQYLLALPGGRYQALSIAWDSRPKTEGGQRWFHLHPEDKVDHRDPLHWTKHQYNWNFMCAECHSTKLEKNYSPATRSYDTTWSEINVACEACHGPAANHVRWAQRGTDWETLEPTKGLSHLFADNNAIWTTDPVTSTPSRSQPRTGHSELQACAACHSRRSQFFEDDRIGQPLMDNFLPALLDRGLYHHDGQILEEDFEYGSFLQSKMFHAGVTCSDCHNPHTLELKAEGNAVCTQCHGAAQFNTPKHHHHPANTPGAQCVNCHMPATTYMQVDARRDHSFRIPQPALTAALGTPNACQSCHRDKPAKWAADQVQNWYGHAPEGFQKFAQTFSDAQQFAPGTDAKLVELLRNKQHPPIVRATAARAMGSWLSQQTVEDVGAALEDEDPLVRMGALEAMQNAPLQARAQYVSPLLDDPSRVIRALAAAQLAELPRQAALPPAITASLQRGLDDYIKAQQFNADDPAAQVNMGNIYAQSNQPAKAEAAYREALALNNRWTSAYVNLVDLYRQQNRNDDAEALLKDALKLEPDNASLHHSLGLVQVRRKQMAQALAPLKRAAQLAPDNGRYAYVYAVALLDQQQAAEALKVVNTALMRNPSDPDLRGLQQQLTTGSN